MSKLDLFTYEGQQIRTVLVDGDPWFVAADVAAVLDMGNVHSSLALLDDDERGLHTVETLGGDQEQRTVSEAGLYSLILRSRKPEAKPFKRWITHQVLPQIRKTGGYGNVAQISRADLARMVLAAEVEKASAMEERDAAQGRVLQLEAPAAAWDRLASANGDYDVRQAAKLLSRDPNIDIGERRLFKTLDELGWIYRDRRHGVKGCWSAYQTALDTKRLVHRTQSHQHPHTGAVVFDPPQVRVTVKGLGDLLRHLGGVQPLPMEVA